MKKINWTFRDTVDHNTALKKAYPDGNIPAPPEEVKAKIEKKFSFSGSCGWRHEGRQMVTHAAKKIGLTYKERTVWVVPYNGNWLASVTTDDSPWNNNKTTTHWIV